MCMNQCHGHTVRAQEVLFFPNCLGQTLHRSGPLNKLHSSATVRNFTSSLVSWWALGINQESGSVQWFLRRAGARGWSEWRQQNHPPCPCSGHKGSFAFWVSRRTLPDSRWTPLCCSFHTFQKSKSESQTTTCDWVSFQDHSGMIKTLHAARMNGDFRWGSQAQPLEPIGDTVRWGEGLPQKQEIFKDACAHNWWRQTSQSIW